MKVKSEREATQSCPTLSDTMDCSPPGSSVHGISQARVLEWGAIACSKKMTKKGQICLLEHERFKSGVEMEGSEASDWKEGVTWKNVFGTIGQIF